MLAGDWRVVDTTAWAPEQDEPGGRREKCWVRNPNGVEIWLRKAPRANRPTEAAIEPWALGLAERVGLSCATGFATTWEEEGGVRRRGILVKNFLGENQILREGHELLRGLLENYNPNDHAAHTLPDVFSVLGKLEEKHSGSRLVLPFFDMLLLDAWIGNSDRHQGNWGCVVFHGGVALCPMYDPAACLGVELGDEHRLLKQDIGNERAIERYVDNCPSGFGNGRTQLISQSEVIEWLARHPLWAERAPTLLARYQRVLDNDVERYLEKVPEEWLPHPRKQLVRRLLKLRLRRLREREVA